MSRFLVIVDGNSGLKKMLRECFPLFSGSKVPGA